MSTDAGKAIKATIPATAPAVPVKRARRTKAEMTMAAPVVVVEPVSEFIPAQTPAPTMAPAPVVVQPVPTVPLAASNNLLAGVDDLLNGLAGLNFDD